MLRLARDGVMLTVRAQPGAKKTAIVGIYGQGAAAQLKIAVHGPPVEGRANAELVTFLTQVFSLPKGAVALASGASSRSKAFLLRGISLTQAEAALSQNRKS